jgi:hypothetical protein
MFVLVFKPVQTDTNYCLEKAATKENMHHHEYD